MGMARPLGGEALVVKTVAMAMIHVRAFHDSYDAIKLRKPGPFRSSAPQSLITSNRSLMLAGYCALARMSIKAQSFIASQTSSFSETFENGISVKPARRARPSFQCGTARSKTLRRSMPTLFAGRLFRFPQKAAGALS
jgi:hypothetical protein